MDNPFGNGNLISCLMVTQASRWRDGEPVGIRAYRQQTHEARELVLVTQDPCEAMDAAGFDVNVVPRDWKLGRMRQHAVELASGEYVATWDDDDLNAPDRLAAQFEALEGIVTAEACMLLRVTIQDELHGRSFFGPRFTWTQTMLARRISMPIYDPMAMTGEDSLLVEQMGRLILLDRPELYTYRIHGTNVAAKAWWAKEVWEKRTGDRP